jgi:soluble lytic murein transglycosylase-like protein
MAPMIRFAELDLRGAFDLAIMIEEDAQLRYERLARLFGDEPSGAGDVFRMMVVCEGRHRTDLLARRDVLFRDAPPRFEISVLGEGVERPDVDEDDLPRTAREALEVARAAEGRAYEFFKASLPQIKEPDVLAFFRQLMEEELEHAAILAKKIAELPPVSSALREQRAPRRPDVAPSPAETCPDRELLTAVVPRFDVATQAVANGVLVEGMRIEDVAAGLGTSRGTVSRKWTRFLYIARQQVAIALAAAALAGCAGSLPHTETSARSIHVGSQPAARALPDRADGERAATALAERARDSAAELAERARDSAAELSERIHAEVATRMPRHGPALHGRVARTIVREARLAGLDPLLVLALISVESSFDPRAVSSAGAFGLMQLLEPTMRRELERSGLSSADPRDPVANVQAGVRYLRRLIDAFGGVDNALMAYNAGPNRIRGHLRHGGIPVRFHGYATKVNKEMLRLRLTLDTSASFGLVPV